MSGFIATIVAVAVRNELLNRFSGTGPDDTRIPMVVAVFAIIASVAGSLASKELLDQVGGEWSPVWIGTLAGLASAILMALLMITYRMYPEPRRAYRVRAQASRKRCPGGALRDACASICRTDCLRRQPARPGTAPGRSAHKTVVAAQAAIHASLANTLVLSSRTKHAAGARSITARQWRCG